MIKAIIWDIGGVLVKMENLTPHRHWEERLGLAAGQLAKTVFGNPIGDLAMIGQATPAEFWQDVGRQLALSGEELEQLRIDFHKAGVWNEKLFALIRSLKGQYKQGIISGAMADAREENQAYLSDDLFDVIVISAEEGIQKPDPDIYRRALARLGVEAHEAIFVDDWLASVEGARSVGLHAIHYTADIDIQEEIRRLIDQESSNS